MYKNDAILDRENIIKMGSTKADVSSIDNRHILKIYKQRRLYFFRTCSAHIHHDTIDDIFHSYSFPQLFPDIYIQKSSITKITPAHRSTKHYHQVD